jgi:hypothetical protein
LGNNKEKHVSVKISDLLSDVEDMRELQARKNGDITPKELLRILLNEVNDGEIQEIAVVRLFKDGSASSGWTSANALELLGLCEILKIQINDFII